MKRLVAFCFALLGGLTPPLQARAAQIANVDYIHGYLGKFCEADAAITPVASEKMKAANVFYLLSVVDKANAQSPYSAATNYAAGPLATSQAADTAAVASAFSNLHNCHAAGAYKSGARCQTCTKNFYCPAGSDSRNECGGSLVTGGEGASEASDCHSAFSPPWSRLPGYGDNTTTGLWSAGAEISDPAGAFQVVDIGMAYTLRGAAACLSSSSYAAGEWIPAASSSGANCWCIIDEVNAAPTCGAWSFAQAFASGAACDSGCISACQTCLVNGAGGSCTRSRLLGGP